LAVFIFCVQMALWVARGHFIVSFGTFGAFLTALATSVFYGVLIWTVYIALEPYVRRRWPQTLIGWSAALIGRTRDPVVGRDVLIGCVAGSAQTVLNGISETWLRHAGGWPYLDSTIPLASARGYLAVLLIAIPHAVREALFFFFLILLLRAMLRNLWVAAVLFAFILASLDLASAGHPLFNASISFLVFFGFAFVVLRWGLLALCVTLLFSSATYVPEARMSAWYFGGTAFVLALALAMAVWAFSTSLGGRKLWNQDFFT
jgi:serine/threonine-protein kinase